MPRYPQWRMVMGPDGIPVGHVEYDLSESGKIHVNLHVYSPPDVLYGYLWKRASDGHYLVDEDPGGCHAEYDRGGVFVSGPYPSGSYIAD